MSTKSRIEQRKEAREFAEQNLEACAASVLIRKAGGVVMQREFRQLVEMCAKWSGLPTTNATEIAESMVETAALRRVALKEAKNGE